MTERFGAKDEKSQAAAVPHPDRRVDAHRAAAREQHRPRHPAGAGRRARRHAEPAHQRLRRGPRPAHRAGRRASRCGPSRSSPYESGVADTVDPLGGLVLRGVPDRRGGGRRPGEYIEQDRRAWAARSPRSRPATCRTRSSRPRSTGPRRSTTARRSSSGSTSFAEADPSSSRGVPDRPGARAPSRPTRLAPLRAERDEAAVDAGAGRRGAAAQGHAEPAVPDEGGPAPPRHPRRGERRAPRGVRGLPAVPLTVRR